MGEYQNGSWRNSMGQLGQDSSGLEHGQLNTEKNFQDP